jgi:hypothetical protein
MQGRKALVGVGALVALGIAALALWRWPGTERPEERPGAVGESLPPDRSKRAEKRPPSSVSGRVIAAQRGPTVSRIS